MLREKTKMAVQMKLGVRIRGSFAATVAVVRVLIAFRTSTSFIPVIC